ncbi:MAG: TonB-dependent receptor [candidate division WOR-3 bacterium]|nr:MAG: TonB-dependent receptor [candidate division WOR-3 bacterium]
MFLMILFLATGDSTVTDTSKTYEIPEIIHPYGETRPAGETTPDYYEYTALDILKEFPVVPLAYGFGVMSKFMNKGRNPAYTRISLNGHPLNTQPFGYFSLGMLPFHTVEQMSFGRTAAGAEFGSFDFESKINSYELPYSFVQFMFGSFESNTYGFDLTRGITDNLGFYMSGSYHKTEGHRENTDAEILSAYSNIYFNLFLPVRLDICYANSDCGYPGSMSLPVEGRQKDEFFDVSTTIGFGKGMGTLYYERQTMDYLDTLYDRTWSVQIDHIGAISEQHDTLFDVMLDYGVNGFYTVLTGETYLPGKLVGFDAWLLLEKWFGRGVIRAAGKLENVSDHDVFLLPRIEVGVKPLGAAMIYAALSRDGRSPSDIETWAPFDTLNPFLTVKGFEFLRSEYCWCGEIGLRGKGFFLNLYRLSFTDYISVFVVDDYIGYGNLDAWETNGLEGYLNLPVRMYNADSTASTEFAIGVSGNIVMNGDPVHYVSRHYASGTISAKRETERLGFGIALRGEYSGTRRDIDGTEYPGYKILSAAGFVKYMGLSCTLRLNNVLDAEYVYLRGYPMPPRNFDVSVKWEFWD